MQNRENFNQSKDINNNNKNNKKKNDKEVLSEYFYCFILGLFFNYQLYFCDRIVSYLFMVSVSF